MPVIKSKPTSPGRRFVVRVVHPDLHKGEPYKPLLEAQSKTGGRNNKGRITWLTHQADIRRGRLALLSLAILHRETQEIVAKIGIWRALDTGKDKPHRLAHRQQNPGASTDLKHTQIKSLRPHRDVPCLINPARRDDA